MVVFVNSEDFLSAARTQLIEDPAYLCISYDTDLLALEDLFHYSEPWIEFAHRNPHITIELRTKSSNFRAISHLQAPPNFILAWTLSPNEVVSRFEHRTPTLEARCRSLRDAQTRGWRVRLCFDPLLMVRDWRPSYSAMIDHVATLVDMTAVCDISVGVFRINGTYLRNMQERNPSSKLLAHSYTVENGSASYSESDRSELQAFVVNHLRRYVSEDKICPVPWQ
jgi:spore photoproduct lyase